MDYYLLICGLKKGPFGFEELLQNGLTADVLVWHVGMTDWRKASEMEELGELLAQLPPPPPNTSAASPSVPPKSWLVESILVTCLCCLPFGVVGIVYAAKVDSAFNSGRYNDALRYSQTAKNWTLWGFFVALGCIVLYLLFLGMIALIGSQSLY